MLAHSNGYKTLMEAISEEDAKALAIKSKHTEIKFVTGSKHIISSNDVYLYGEVDLENPSDLKYIEKFSNAILNPYNIGNFYYSSFDYDTGTITKNEDKDVFLGYQIMDNPIKWFKYHYCLIGKPKHIILYKVPYDKRY